ncbi:MAG: hypothetical protein ACK5JJ_05480 [Cyanobacteriota bacterium]|jgi:hypothetical protein
MRGGFRLLNRRRIRCLAWLVAVLAGGMASPPTGAEGLLEPTGDPSVHFGRWEKRTKSCRIEHQRGTTPGAVQSCLGLKLEQQQEGLLSVRFLHRVEGSTLVERHLLFAGFLERDRSMRCQEGRCTPRPPLELLVTLMATAHFDAQGLAQGLPDSQLAKGHCRLERRRIRCAVTSREGIGLATGSGPEDHWLAEATF